MGYAACMAEPWESEPRAAVIIENHLLARGTHWVALQIQDDRPLLHRAGNIISLYVDVGGKRQRRPYTVSAVNPEGQEIGLLLRIIRGGQVSSALSYMGQGNEVAVSGRMGKPIHELIYPGAKQFVGVSTGSGIGPLAGFVREALSDPNWQIPMTLVCGFRSEADICLIEQLDAMSEDPRFTWYPSLSAPEIPDYSGPRGRVTRSLPEILPSLKGAHVHLVGNGAMVSEMRGGLSAAGMEPERISSEIYFNRGHRPDGLIVARLAERYRGAV